ncbi:MAG TPA: flagellar motor switch protein FliG [Candidatus Hydrogenedentes bacterium]|nr:flagellar motor switch protein FliG [Candidatus Hydrogenedentota bacterium]HPC15439.1 flagellar motor switch protein FliG [Candidatus Hydrogenedentota bacterium]HRT21122.1 flagellar motor switch protein FliG [Candidatus Hydrogenedentota bacterium]HRT64347.1 flagellar motor switch protein FliG [Candidatus Hydrogenedentota bacterium]
MRLTLKQRTKTETSGPSGREKAAILLACLGPKAAGKVLSSLNEDEVEQLTLDLSSLGPVEPDVRMQVMEEFYRMAMAKRFVSQGGIDFARNLLENAFGNERALEILTRLQSSLQEVPFEFLKRADPAQICSFIQDEHPQTIALILAHLNPQISSVILSSLPQEIRADVVVRIAAMDRTPPEIVREVERVLERKMASVFSQGFTFAGGVKEVAEILNRIDRNAEKTIMADLEERDPELADEIARLMFTFDDLVYVEDGGIQKALREIETKDLAMALKSASEEVKEKVFRNMSERAREMILEEIEFMGPVRLKQVEEAQQKIVSVVRRLEDAGELVVQGRGGGSEDQLVV